MTNQSSATPETTSEPNSDIAGVTSKELATLRKQLDSYEGRTRRSAKRHHEALTERNQLVACLARIFTGSHLVKSAPIPPTDVSKEPVIRDICCVHLPNGRNLTWPIEPRDMKYFSRISYSKSDFDGHTITQKYYTLEEVSLETVLETLSATTVLEAIMQNRNISSA